VAPAGIGQTGLDVFGLRRIGRRGLLKRCQLRACRFGRGEVSAGVCGAGLSGLQGAPKLGQAPRVGRFGVGVAVQLAVFGKAGGCPVDQRLELTPSGDLAVHVVADNALAFARERNELVQGARQPAQQVAARRLRIFAAGAGELGAAVGDVLLGRGQPALDALDHAGLLAQALDAHRALLSRFPGGARGAQLLLQGGDLLADLVHAGLCVLGQRCGVARDRRGRRRLPAFGLLVAVGFLAGDRHPLAARLAGQLSGVLLAGDEASA
jgi:hypothetical protein